MAKICNWLLRISFDKFKFGFECFELCLNGENLHSNPSNPFRMVRICIRMLRIPLKSFKFGFESFKSLLIGLNLYLNASNPFQMVRICIRMLQIPLFEWFQFPFEWLESFSMAGICIWMLLISFKGFEFAFECFEFLLNGMNLHSYASNPFKKVQIWIRMLRIPFYWIEFAFEYFESLLNG